MKTITVLAIAAVMIAGAAGAATAEQCLVSTLVFSSTRDFPTVQPASNEVYLLDPGGTNPRRLTDNSDADWIPKLSPDGKRIVFDSNRARGAGEPVNAVDLFWMKADGKDQAPLTQGSSASWSPDGKWIAFQRSASGTGLPENDLPSGATTDSDIFIMRVPDDDDPTEEPINITNSQGEVDEDPDWSPDGKKIAFTRHPDTEQPTQRPFHYPSKRIYVLDLETGGIEQLTHGDAEERAPAWSPDGTQIAYMCRIGPLDGFGVPTFEICVINADGTAFTRLTNNTVQDTGGSWSPDGQQFLFTRNVAGQGTQVFVMNADGTGQTQVTFGPGNNQLASWGVVRDKCDTDN